MNLDMSSLVDVWVYSDGGNYLLDEFFWPPGWKEIYDYSCRKTTHCKTCDSLLYIHYGEDLASCDCGIIQWPM